MTTSGDSAINIQDEPRPWKSGPEPYQFSFPKHEGDSWEILFKYLYEQDRSRCDAWREEVSNLLIFAGLLSAVVTAFVIETYKTLSPDSDNTVINLLTIIAARVGNSTDGFTLPPVSDPYQLKFAAPSPALSINIFFFVSLVLSLSTALISIVCLQWLTIHQDYPNTLTGPDRLALLHMRTESFRRWKVPELFSSLPILIQLALVSFFIGLASFLWSIDHTVVIPVAILIGITLLFLISTTILPTIQIFLLERPYLMNLDPLPTECPYRSPQAAACRYFFGSSFFSFLFSLAILIPIFTYRSSLRIIEYCKVATRRLEELDTNATVNEFILPRLVYHCSRWFSNNVLKMSLRRLHYISGYINGLALPLNYDNPLDFQFLTYICDVDSLPASRVKNSWVDIGVGWLNVRDILFRHNCGPSSWLYWRTHYDIMDVDRYCDIVHGIKATIFNNTAVTDELISAAVHSIQALRRGRHTKAPEILHYCSMILVRFPGNIAELPDFELSVPQEVFDDQSVYLLLGCLNIGSSPAASTLQAEIVLRLMGYICDCDRFEPAAQGAISLTLGDKFPSILLSHINYALDNTAQFFVHQWALNVHSSFKAIIKDGQQHDSIRNGALANPIFHDSLQFLMTLLHYGDSSRDQRARHTLLSMLKFITYTLTEFMEDDNIFPVESDTTPSAHCFFYCASVCFVTLERVTQPDRRGDWIDYTIVQSLQECLKRYRARAEITSLPIQNLGCSTVEVGGRVWHYDPYDLPPLFSESWWKEIDNWTPVQIENVNTPHLENTGSLMDPNVGTSNMQIQDTESRHAGTVSTTDCVYQLQPGDGRP